MNQLTMRKQANTGGLVLLRKPVQRQEAMAGLREATTGRLVVAESQSWPAVVSRARFRARVVAMPRPLLLERVQAMADATAETAAETAAEAAAATGAWQEPKVELAFYRRHTEGMLRRYLQLSTQMGRVPSLLGRELFQGNVSSYKVRSFEDSVIFCFDVEKVLGRLSSMDKELVRRIAMQQYSQGEAASMLGMSLAHLKRLYGSALDRLTAMLLEANLMDPQKSCQ